MIKLVMSTIGGIAVGIMTLIFLANQDWISFPIAAFCAAIVAGFSTVLINDFLNQGS